jgi:hypothetical protein
MKTADNSVLLKAELLFLGILDDEPYLKKLEQG